MVASNASPPGRMGIRGSAAKAILIQGRVLRIPNFRLLFIGQTTSALGSVIQSVAVSWLVLELTGSALALGGVLIVSAIPGVLTAPVGGLLSDRLGPRPILIGSDVARTICIAVLAVLVVSHAVTMPALYAILATSGAIGGLFNPAANSMPPALVPHDQLRAANSLNQSAVQLAMILGAPLAGIVVASFGTAGAIAINAATFGVSALASILITRTPAVTRDKDRSSRAMTLEGLSYLRTTPWLASLLVVDALFTMAAVGPFGVGLPLLARGASHTGPVGLGTMLSAMGAGAAVGMLWAGAHAVTRRRGLLFALAHLPQGGALMFVPLASLLPASALLALIGVLSGWASVVYLSMIQSTVPGELMGRVMSLVAITSIGLTPISQLAAAAISGTSGVTVMMIAAGSLMVLTSIVALSLRPLRAIQ